MPCTFGGETSPQFQTVAQKFRENFAAGRELASQLVIYHKQRKVVDEWGRLDANAFTKDYDGDTLQNIFSSGKVTAALCIAMLVDKGHFSYSTTVSSVWPEFSAHGKDSITVADVLRHEAGLATFDGGDLSRPRKVSEALVRDLDGLAAHVAASVPTMQGKRCYHSITRGWILSEIIR